MYAVGMPPPSASATLTTEYAMPVNVSSVGSSKNAPQIDSRTMNSMIVCMDEIKRLMELNDPKKEMRIYTANGGVTIFTLGETKGSIKYSCTEKSS
jgi:hypothetical protein